MAKPLRSEIRNPPNRQFEHFGVLNTGGQSKGAFFGSIVFNVILALIAVIIGASVKKISDNRVKEVTLVVPLKEKPPEPPKPKVPPPPKLPPPPKVEPKIEPPKIKLPDVKIPDPPKPVPVPVPKPIPVVVPAPPKIQPAAAAPKVQSVSLAAKSASIPNNDAHPSPVRLGMNSSPISTLSGPAVAPVNMRSGIGGMPPSNSGSGPRATAVSLGNGSPDGKIGGTVPTAVAGIPKGVIGGTGTAGNGNRPQLAQVALGGAPPPPPAAVTVTKASVRTAPQVLFKPKPVYTAEAEKLHIEGSVVVRVHVSSSGAVSVMSVSGSLGHGLEDSARQCALGIRFKPAVDANGNPMDWEGPITITFQMA